jgi:hypothetical protein
MRLLALSWTLFSFAALAGEPAAPADQAGKPAAPEAAAAPVAATPAPERKRVCQRETTVGSSIPRTVCRDEQRPGEGAQALDSLRNSVNRVPPSPH